VLGPLVETREQLAGRGWHHRGVVVLAGEGSDRVHRVEPHDRDELHFVAEVASEHLDLPEPVDRTILDAGDDLVAQQRLVGIGVAGRGVPMPDAADHDVSKAVS